MKNTILLLTLIVLTLWSSTGKAQFLLDKSKRYGKGKIVDVVSTKASAPKRDDKELLKLKNKLALKEERLRKAKEKSKKQLARLKELAKRRAKKPSYSPLVISRKRKITALYEATGVLRQQIQIAEGQRKNVTQIVSWGDKRLPNGTKFLCKAGVQTNRVVATCNKMVVNGKPYKNLNVIIVDEYDGEEGLFADDIRDEKDSLFIKSFLADGLSLSADAAKDRYDGSNSQVERRTGENIGLSMIQGGMSGVSQRIKEDANKDLRILTINPGRKLLISFLDEVEL